MLALLSLPATGFAPPPSSLDWRTKGVIDPPRNQGALGSSSAAAAFSTLTALHKITTGSLATLSWSEMNECCATADDFGPEGIYECVNSTTHGLCSEAAYPSGGGGTCHAGECEAILKIRGYDVVARNNQSALQAATAARPVAAGVAAASPAFMYYTGGIIDKGCDGAIDHYVLVVGYGTDTSGTDFWIVQNSWGADWGENGYARIKRGPGNVCGLATHAVAPKM
jgi:hypothetical protein